jgi:hypothetical protein
MREELRINPMAWLASGPIVILNPASILSTFRPASARVVRFAGPHTLYRAAGWDSTHRKMASAYGSWWADAVALTQIGHRITMFEKWLPPDLLRRAWPVQYRGMAALCEDWNDMREMFQLDLPQNDELIGLAGIAAPQPRLSTMNSAARKTPMLQGGGEQVYFKKTGTLNSVNPLWVRSALLW